MKKEIWIGAFFLLGVCFGVGAQEVAAVKSPNIVILEELFDFGTVMQGEIVTHSFILKNTGEADLTVNARPSCGCMATFTTNPIIPPGQSTELKVTFNSSGYNNTVEKQVYINSNDSKTPTKTITIKGIVKALPKVGISVEPAVWTAVSSASGQPSTFQFNIENRGNSALRISSIDTPAGVSNASISSADIEPHKSTMVTLNLKQDAKPENGKETIYLKIDLPLQYQAPEPVPAKTEIKKDNVIPVQGTITKDPVIPAKAGIQK